MSERPTPETDAFAVKFKSVCGSKDWVPTDICRRLERERDEWAALCGRYKQERDDLIKDRNRLRSIIDRCRETFDLTPVNWEAAK